MNVEDMGLKTIMEAGGRLRVRSALNPILWLCGIISLPTIMYSNFSVIPLWLVVLAYLPVSVCIIGFLYLLFVDRDKLQSEEYQLKKRQLEMVGQKGYEGAIPANEVTYIETPEKAEQ